MFAGRLLHMEGEKCVFGRDRKIQKGKITDKFLNSELSNDQDALETRKNLGPHSKDSTSR